MAEVAAVLEPFARAYVWGVGWLAEETAIYPSLHTERPVTWGEIRRAAALYKELTKEREHDRAERGAAASLPEAAV